SQQQANAVLRHDLPKFRPKDPDISAGLSFPSMRFHLVLGPRQLPCPFSPTALEARHDAQKAIPQPLLPNLLVLQRSSLLDFTLGMRSPGKKKKLLEVLASKTTANPRTLGFFSFRFSCHRFSRAGGPRPVQQGGGVRHPPNSLLGREKQ